MDNKIRCYISHSIRGKFGKDATAEQMIENNKKAIAFYHELQQKFPNVDFYCPGFHDEFVMIAFAKGYLTEKQMLAVDCTIIDRCDCIIDFMPDGYLSDGMYVENKHALINGKRVLIMKDVNDCDVLSRWLIELKS